MAKNSYNVYFLPLVRTKASEPSDIPGVNTPLNVFVNFLKLECFGGMDLQRKEISQVTLIFICVSEMNGVR